MIGHSGDSDDLDYLRALLDTGVTLGMDRFGMAHTGDDEAGSSTVLALLAEGYADQLVLSHDSAYFSRVTPPSWRASTPPHWTHDHLSRRIAAASCSTAGADREGPGPDDDRQPPTTADARRAGGR